MYVFYGRLISDSENIHLELMGNHDNCFIFKCFLDVIIEDVYSNMDIHSAQWIVQQEQIL